MDNETGVARARAKDIREAWAEVVGNASDFVSHRFLYSKVLYEKLYLSQRTSFPPKIAPHLRHFLLLLFSCNICLRPYHTHSPRKKKNTKTMAPIRILIINPNTDQSMTDSLREPIESLGYNNVTSSLSLSQFLLSQPNSAHSPD